MTENVVDIGFLDEKESWLLHPRFFPSKVGGKPAWLDLRNIPAPSELTCNQCNEVMIFLCQVYAPYEEKEDSFHRTIFIFVCKNGECCRPNSANNFKVFRSQLPRKNDFYSFEPYKEDQNETFPMDKWPKLCNVCGVKAPSHCAKCKKEFYCSRKHQIIHWQKGHKELCCNSNETDNSNFIVTEAAKSLLFKEWELIVDEEDQEKVKHVDENQEMEKLKHLIKEKKAGTMSDINESELEEYTGKIPDDKVFNKFSKRIARHPDQVLRYDRGGVPLWITAQADNIDIPKCSYCNEPRQFEFQIMPQLLNFINIGIEINSIDWGILAIYTCNKSCNKGPAYKEEMLIKQDLSN
ncbi:programmed cell death protein 2-like [Zerene cesonia]|uniref:programmed cell death protein 2-like n=1 Tax=Zerene cesonia TaxID=33412 RepID=UPI0018E54333|nr:programmed cell death protein 2-like [Zerene cesonia]